MSWLDQINGDPLSWLLEKTDPGVRYLAMRRLEGRHGNDPELLVARSSAHRDGPIASILDEMNPEGYWVKPGPGYSQKYRSSVWALILLAQLGADTRVDPRIEKGAIYLLEHALTPMGQLSTSGAPSETIDCLQGNLCWALATLGITDPRLEIAYDWLARSVTGEGIAPANEKHAPLRYYAYKCGPNFACGANNKLPCAWGAAKVMLALAVCPPGYRTPLVERAIAAGADFLLSVDPATGAYPVGTGGKPSRNWWKFGFPVFYVTDILQVVEALAASGYGGDPRLASAKQLILSKQDTDGRWLLEYDYAGKTYGDFGAKQRASKWVTLRALGALMQSDV